MGPYVHLGGAIKKYVYFEILLNNILSNFSGLLKAKSILELDFKISSLFGIRLATEGLC